MSELKFSCPHCAQHISCDSAWAGQSLQCPSCHKQITAPQIPTGVLISQTPTARPLSAKLRANLQQARMNFVPPGMEPAMGSAPPVIGAGQRARGSGFNFSVLRVAIVLGCIFVLLFGAALGWSFYRRSIRNRERAEFREAAIRQQAQRAESARTGNAAPAPILYREPKLDLPTNAVAGQIGGQEFHYEHAIVSMHNFMLREGKYWQPDRQVSITTFVKPQDLAGKTLLVTPDNKFPRLSLHAEWLDSSQQRKYANASSGYYLQLKCGPIENGRMTGTIDLRMPGAPPTAVKGNFVAAVK